MKDPFGLQLEFSVFGEPERRKQIKYLNIILIYTFVLTVLLSILVLDLLRSSPLRLALSISALTLNIVALRLLKSGYLRLTGIIVVSGYWILATILIFQTGGFSSPWLLTQMSITVFAGLLAGGWAGIVVAGLSVFTDFILYQLQLIGFLTFPHYDAPLMESWASTLINLSFGAIIIIVARRHAIDSLDRVRTGEKRYRSLFEKTNDAVFLIDLNQSYLDVNQRAADLLGYSIDELIGMPVKRVIVPEERNSSQEKIKLLSEESVIPLYYERTVVCKDGSRKVVEVNLALVSDEDGNPLHYQSIVRDVSERKLLEHQLTESLTEMENIAMQDSLTGILNRRAIMEHAEAEWHRSQREERPMCLVLIDVDNLKTINDTHGHLVGDEALMKLAQAINGSKRRYDWIGRWGGDEFLMVLPGENLLEAQEVAERLRNLIKEIDIVHEKAEPIKLKVSLGVACYTGRVGDDTSIDKTLSQADQALYNAKESGRDRIAVYRD